MALAKGSLGRVDEADVIAIKRARNAKKRRSNDPCRDFDVARGKPHRLRLVLIIPDGVEGEAETRG